jgi:DNA-binding CsgD family transcriptional regulator
MLVEPVEHALLGEFAQIARELYVTRSTVAFHLSNAYAKTGTTSRHELVQLVRTA